MQYIYLSWCGRRRPYISDKLAVLLSIKIILLYADVWLCGFRPADNEGNSAGGTIEDLGVIADCYPFFASCGRSTPAFFN